MTDQETIRAALAHIPADDRELWLRIGMAIHAEYPDDTGADLFDAWSQSGEGYNARDVRDVWRSFKPGRVTIGTLYHEAKARGWQGKPPAALDAEAERQRREQRDRQRAADEAKYREKAQAAAREAAALWDSAREKGSSAYLDRKGVRGHGVRYRMGDLLIPLRDAAGTLHNLQIIAPEKPSAEGEARGLREKRFLAGGRKSGLWHMLGDPARADVIVIAEGYATATSVHEATERPVAVAFDAGNLAKVAQALHAAWPDARLLIAGDDDRDTQARTGTNPGRSKAEAAARAVDGLAVFPEGLPDGCSDMNDLAQHAGPAKVREIIEAAAADLLLGKTQAPSRAKAKAADPKAEPPAKRPAKTAQAARSAARTTEPSSKPAERASGAPDASADDSDDFIVTDEGVYRLKPERDGKHMRQVWVCPRIEVTAIVRDPDGDDWARLVEFRDPDGRMRKVIVSDRTLRPDGSEHLALLAYRGFMPAPGREAKNYLTEYLQTRRPSARVIRTDRTGWFRNTQAFVLPSKVFQPPAGDGDTPSERIIFEPGGHTPDPFKTRGRLEDWQREVAHLCEGNSRLMFAVACAFTGPLVKLAGIESGGFNLFGNSGAGKSSSMCAARSVWGDESYKQEWRGTANGVEGMATAFCSLTLLIDDLKQIDAKEIDPTVYMIANGREKARKNDTANLRKIRSWELIFLSASEDPAERMVAMTGKKVYAGFEVRMPDIPAEVSPGTAFESIHHFDGPGPFADHLQKVSREFYGTAGDAWLDWIVKHYDEARDRVRKEIERLTELWIDDKAGGQVRRVIRRFALVAAAGEMATDARITGWHRGAATEAVRQCFQAWIEGRPGGSGSSEEARALRQVRQWLFLNGVGRFTAWGRALDDHAPDKGLRAGFRRLVKASNGEPLASADYPGDAELKAAEARGEIVTHYYVEARVFDEEVCKGFQPLAVRRVLRDRGFLIPEGKRPFDCKPCFPGVGHVTCYRLSHTIFAAEDL